MTDRVQEIRDRLEAATPGPWEAWAGLTHDGERQDGISPRGDLNIDVCFTIISPQGSEDAEFIAHAPDDIEFLLAEVERLQNDLEVARDALRDEIEFQAEDHERFYGDWDE